MKKAIAFMLALTTVLSLSACKGKGSKNAKNDIPHEQPFSGNAAYVPYEDGEFTSKYDKDADKLREEILNMKDSKPTTELVYYISYRGNDENDGLSEKTPWATTANLVAVPENSTVLFERDGVYRTSGIDMKSNTFYGAYGEGPKPCIYGSLQNYADESLWTQYSDNLWKIELDNASDVGNIIFDNGKMAAQRVYNKERLTQDYMYLYGNNTVFLYLSKGNPGALHDDIEITMLGNGAVFKGKWQLTNVTLENLCIKYGNFGIQAGANNKGVTVRGCEIGYIGGCTAESKIYRWGNGIEFWGSCNDATVEKCWVYQCYDAGITNQCSEPTTMDNIKYDNNLIEFCQNPIEFFHRPGATTKNIFYTNNILRFAGYQVFDPKERHGSDSSHTALILTYWQKKYTVENFIIENNILDTSYGYLLGGDCFNTSGGITVRNNSYYQQTGLKTFFFETDKNKIVPSVAKLEDGIVYTAQSKAELEKGVAKVDSSPKAVDFQSK